MLLLIEENKLKIMATDLEITHICWCDCKIIESGGIAIPGKLLLDIIREMPESELTFTTDDNFKIELKSSLGEKILKIQEGNPPQHVNFV